MTKPLARNRLAGPTLLMMAAGFAAPAWAQPELGLRAADANGDSLISLEEARSAAAQQFARLDANHDGMVSQQEFVDARLALFKLADSNGDGQLSRGEIRSELLSQRRQP